MVLSARFSFRGVRCLLSEIIFYENYIYVRKYYYIDINSSKKTFFSGDINDIYTYSQTGESTYIY